MNSISFLNFLLIKSKGNIIIKFNYNILNSALRICIGLPLNFGLGSMFASNYGL